MFQQKIRIIISIFYLLILISGCVKTKKDVQSTNASAKLDLYALTGVNIIPMTSGNEIITGATVVIRNHKIESINQPVPDSAQIIDGKGKWLIPGLIDMHVHGFADINFGESYPTQGATFFVNDQDAMLLYVVNGITTIFDLNARVENFAQRNEIAEGNVIGPRMALAALINGGEGDGRIANTPEDGRQSVRMAKAEGYDFIKVYSQLNKETFLAIAEEAVKQGMKVVGHIPNDFSDSIEKALVPNFGMVAHAEEFAKQSNNFSNKDIQLFVQLAKRSGTWLTPTLITIERITDQAESLDSIKKLKGFSYIHPLMQDKWLHSNNYNKGADNKRIAHLKDLINFNNQLVKAFQDAGIPLVAGTDAGCSGVIWGFALHDELELLVKAGLSPEEALISATRLPSQWLGIEDKIGTIEVGKFADLILLDANPLEDIKNTQKIRGAFFNGRWISREVMDEMLSDLETRNAQNIGKFEWKKRKMLDN
ncbi:MAG: amidohydrolase family protein [Bacteroidetes bacterium]|nr:amidohydrolase family protein [Bacteroidota bacterium]